MTEITFQIDWKGHKEDVIIDDDIAWGHIDMILKNSTDLSDPTKPKVDMKEYRARMIPAVIVKAPFKHTDNDVLRKVGYKTMYKITKEVMRHYPLALFLEEWMQSFLGSLEETNSDSGSTPTASSDSDGQKKKSTDTDGSSSNKSSHTPKKE